MTDPTHNHHDGLPHADVRNIIADGLRDHKVSLGFYSGNSVEARSALIERIEAAKRQLEAFDKGQGLLAIAQAFDFREFDVSDLVSYNSETYRAFIGTVDEAHERYPKLKVAD